MKKMGISMLMLLFCALLFSPVVFADRDDGDRKNSFRVGAQYDENGREEDEGEDEAAEELGEATGWGIVAAAVAAGLLYPMRKFLERLLKNMPASKKQIATFIRWLKKIHIPIGLIAILLSLVHGITMYFSKGKLGPREWIGMGSVGLAIFATFFGIALIYKKKRSSRLIHMGILAFAGLFALIHIALS